MQADLRPHLTIYIDDAPYQVPAGRRSGAELRALTNPAPTELWLDVEDAQDRLVAPGDVIDVTEYMRFFTGQSITIFLDGEPYSVPPGSISEDQLRKLAIPVISEDFGLFRDVVDVRDHRIAPGEILLISDGDRFYSAKRHHAEVTIIVNATPHAVPIGVISFATVVHLAYPTPPGPEPEYSVTYRKGGPKHPTGILQDGQTIPTREGMIFVVTATDKS